MGFILGPIIDGNIQSALDIHGTVGMVTRPLTIALFVLVVLTTILFTYFMGRTEQMPQAPVGGVLQGVAALGRRRAPVRPAFTGARR